MVLNLAPLISKHPALSQTQECGETLAEPWTQTWGRIKEAKKRRPSGQKL